MRKDDGYRAMPSRFCDVEHLRGYKILDVKARPELSQNAACRDGWLRSGSLRDLGEAYR